MFSRFIGRLVVLVVSIVPFTEAVGDPTPTTDSRITPVHEATPDKDPPNPPPKPTIDPKVTAIMQEALEELRMSGIRDNATKVGQFIPYFSLPDSNNQMFDSAEALKKGPLVVVFYRGGWCPYCNLHLRELQKNLSQMKALGAQLVAISPQSPDLSMTTAEKNELKFSVLSDAGGKIASKFGIVFSLSPKLMEVYRGFGIDLEKLNVSKEWALPLPASFVVDQSGQVAYAFVEEDYKSRARPADILDALKYLKEH